MNDLIINPNKTASFSGHRILGQDFDLERVKSSILRLIKDGYDTFLVGMAIGFDTACFKVLLDLKKEFPIKIIACIPCLNQSERFNYKQKEEYEYLLNLADDKIVISKEYTNDCMKRRNKFLVEYSTVLICYLRRDKTGTSSTVNYALKRGVKVILI